MGEAFFYPGAQLTLWLKLRTARLSSSQAWLHIRITQKAFKNTDAQTSLKPEDSNLISLGWGPDIVIFANLPQ